MSIEAKITKQLADIGYSVSAQQRQVLLKKIKVQRPAWRDLYAPGLSDQEIEKIDKIIEPLLDQPMMLGNLNLGGSYRFIYGQENIDRQVRKIMQLGRPAAVIWHLQISKIVTETKEEKRPEAKMSDGATREAKSVPISKKDILTEENVEIILNKLPEPYREYLTRHIMAIEKESGEQKKLFKSLRKNHPDSTEGVSQLKDGNATKKLWSKVDKIITTD